MSRRVFAILVLTAAVASGCSTPALLSRSALTETPWKSFEATKSAYDRIVPGETRLAEELSAATLVSALLWFWLR